MVGGDVLEVINYINAARPEMVPQDGRGGGPYIDVTGDGHIAADDVVAVINYINSHPATQQSSALSVASWTSPNPAVQDSSQQALSADLLNLLAIDLAGQPKLRR